MTVRKIQSVLYIIPVLVFAILMGCYEEDGKAAVTAMKETFGIETIDKSSWHKVITSRQLGNFDIADELEEDKFHEIEFGVSTFLTDSSIPGFSCKNYHVPRMFVEMAHGLERQINPSLSSTDPGNMYCVGLDFIGGDITVDWLNSSPFDTQPPDEYDLLYFASCLACKLEARPGEEKFAEVAMAKFNARRLVGWVTRTTPTTGKHLIERYFSCLSMSEPDDNGYYSNYAHYESWKESTWALQEVNGSLIYPVQKTMCPTYIGDTGDGYAHWVAIGPGIYKTYHHWIKYFSQARTEVVSIS